TLVLSLIPPDSQRYAEAWKRIEDIARDPKNPASLGALVLLANEQAVPPMAPLTSPSLSIASASTPNPSSTAAAPPSVAGSVDAGGAIQPPPAAQRAADSSPPVSLDSTPQPTPATQSGDTVTLNLAATSRSRPAGRTMSLREVANALENHPDARPYHKLLAFEVRARQDQAQTDQYVADAVESHSSRAHLGSATASTNEWQPALQVADTPEKLLTLATNAEQNSANDIADAAYSEAIKIAPTNRAAYTGRLRLALAAGNTAQAQTIAAEIARVWPDDA